MGNIGIFVDGVRTDANYNLLTAFNNFNNAGNGYTNNGQTPFINFYGGFMKKPHGTTEKGFIIKESGASGSTWFSDKVYVYSDKMAVMGGYANDEDGAGIFSLELYIYGVEASSYQGARLMYL